MIPGYLPRHGILPAQSVRDLAATAKFKPLPVPTEPTEPNEPGYRPSVALSEFIRWRDLTCRFPGCDAPAQVSDIDHTVPYPYGPTHPSNGKLYCRSHRRFHKQHFRVSARHAANRHRPGALNWQARIVSSDDQDHDDDSSPDKPVMLVLENSKGERHRVDLDGPGGRIRFAVGEPGCRSAIWQVESPKTKHDVYISVASIMGTLKWSLHKSGSWRLQWGDRLKAWKFAQTDDRLISEWTPPDEAPEIGWVRPFVINVRHRDLIPFAEEGPPLTDEIIWIPPPEPGQMVSIHVIIARAVPQWVTLQNLLPFAGFMLADRRVLLLLRSVYILDEDEHNHWDKELAEVARNTPEMAGANPSSARMMSIGYQSSGARQVWDLAIPQSGK